MLSDKQNTSICFHTNTTDAEVPEIQRIDPDTMPTKPTKVIVSLTNTDIYQIIRQSMIINMKIHFIFHNFTPIKKYRKNC